METKHQISAIDPVVYYSRLLRDERKYQELRYIDPMAAKVIIKDGEMAEKLLRHPNYMIRTIYAKIATDPSHISALRQDDDVRVRDGLMQNPLRGT